MIEFLGHRELVGKLRKDKAFNLQFLEEEFSIGKEQIEALYEFAKLNYETGSYERAASLVRRVSRYSFAPPWGGARCGLIRFARRRSPRDASVMLRCYDILGSRGPSLPGRTPRATLRPAVPCSWSHMHLSRRTTRGCSPRTGAGSGRRSFKRGRTSSGSTPTPRCWRSRTRLTPTRLASRHTILSTSASGSCTGPCSSSSTTRPVRPTSPRPSTSSAPSGKASA